MQMLCKQGALRRIGLVHAYTLGAAGLSSGKPYLWNIWRRHNPINRPVQHVSKNILMDFLIAFAQPLDALKWFHKQDYSILSCSTKLATYYPSLQWNCFGSLHLSHCVPPVSVLDSSFDAIACSYLQITPAVPFLVSTMECVSVMETSTLVIVLGQVIMGKTAKHVRLHCGEMVVISAL